MEDKEEIFKEYASNYLDLSPLMKLKLNHTLRVEKLSRRIAIEENFSDEEIKISTLCGLLHDIGRFEQFQRYSSFNDSKNEDHANLGVKVLMENNLINKFNENEEQNLIILKAIYNHNKYCIDEELSEEEAKITNLLRDADKLDILNLYVIKEINLNIGEETFSENMFNTLLNHQSVSLKDKKTSADKLAISLGFVFDLNYRESYQILKEKDYINKEIDMYIEKTNNKELIKQLNIIRKVIYNYIDYQINKNIKEEKKSLIK